MIKQLRLLPALLWHSAAMAVYPSLEPQKIPRRKLQKMLQTDATDFTWQEVHSGTTSRWRLQFAEQSLFVKTNPPDFTTRLFGAQFRLSSNELGFYRQLQTAVEVPTPDSPAQWGNRYRYIILLEDLSDSAEFSTVKMRCDLQRAKSVLATLAKLHAGMWQDARFDSDWRWVNRQEYQRNHALQAMLRTQSSVAAVKRYRDMLPEDITATAKMIVSRYPLLQQHWQQGERTLVHGDAHIGNMYFLDDGRTGLLDWQVLGFEQGMRDVTYFMINSLPTDLRREHQDALMAFYVEQLNKHGVTFTLQQAQQQYLLHASYVWISAAVTAASNTMQERKIAAAGLIRSSKAMQDLSIASFLQNLQ